jgi:cbb3-type cytochrome oxidase maturation protein
MDILYLLIPLSLVFVAAIAVVFLWAVKTGQFEDMEGPAHRILMDDDIAPLPRDSAESRKTDNGAD